MELKRNIKRNIKLTIEYDGTKYHGWQIQKNKSTVQGTIRDALINLTGETLILYGAGRTDSGVHAKAQVAHFHTYMDIPDYAFAKALNTKLPSDIVILESKTMPDEFHAQFDATKKTYSYRILNRPFPPAIDRNYCFWVWHPLDLDKMRQASQYLVGEKDFFSFASAHSDRKSTIRCLNFIDISKNNCYITIQMEADGFLYHMVRNIVGTLIAVGTGKILPEYVAEILSAKNRRLAGPTVPARGLYLECVHYL
ncbi:MAG: tRNA pseudouridine(38-40) synthase TruA [Planctomycetes bacterium]|jgi:tRNA pseudouridine38-40 synthase|nr:tRNA pseudouridine(38-40) synthase TruA [Planctomycetota bacterium]HPY74396.1 tRNA pseudouridine(38-40) synthase TruA [Planctomycetota bacterium]HQA99944.1 tRNA pseudouridine(38-40) synthase TruA [Planctomycetota bacterium]